MLDQIRVLNAALLETTNQLFLLQEEVNTLIGNKEEKINEIPIDKNKIILISVLVTGLITASYLYFKQDFFPTFTSISSVTPETIKTFFLNDIEITKYFNIETLKALGKITSALMTLRSLLVTLNVPKKFNFSTGPDSNNTLPANAPDIT